MWGSFGTRYQYPSPFRPETHSRGEKLLGVSIEMLEPLLIKVKRAPVVCGNAMRPSVIAAATALKTLAIVYMHPHTSTAAAVLCTLYLKIACIRHSSRGTLTGGWLDWGIAYIICTRVGSKAASPNKAHTHALLRGPYCSVPGMLRESASPSSPLSNQFCLRFW